MASLGKVKIVVVGSNGWIGREVSALALRRGLEVVGISRAPMATVPGIAYRTCDIADEAAVLALARDPIFSDAAALIHCAAHVHRPHETPEEIARFEAVNIHGTRHIVEFGRRIAARGVYLGSIGVYDWSRGTDWDEEAEPRPTSAYARSKLAGEAICRKSNADWRIVRLGTLFGTGDSANFARLATAVRRGRFIIPGQGDARKSVLPIHLAAELIVELSLRDHVGSHLVNLALPATPTLAQVCDTFSEMFDVRPSRRVPAQIVAAGALLGDAIDHIRPGFSLTTSNVRKLTTSTTVKVDRMRALWPEQHWPEFRAALANSKSYYCTFTDTETK